MLLESRDSSRALINEAGIDVAGSGLKGYILVVACINSIMLH